MEKIGAIRRPARVVVDRQSGGTARGKHPPGGDASSHCKPFGKCTDGFIWDCVYDKVDVCDADHKGKVEMRLKTHGCNNCEPTGKGPIDYSWWTMDDKGSRPGKNDPGWKKDSDTSSITIRPSKDYKIGDKIWVKQQAICAEYKGNKNEKIDSIFAMKIVPCDDDGQVIDEECKKDSDCKEGRCCDGGNCKKCDDTCECENGNECCGGSNPCGQIHCEDKDKPNCCNGICHECCRNQHCADNEECIDNECVPIDNTTKGKCVTIGSNG